MGIPNGCPLIYRFEHDKSQSYGLKPVVQPMAVPPLSGEFLEKKNLLRNLLAREAELSASVPGFDREGGSAPREVRAGVVSRDGDGSGDGLTAASDAGADDPMAFLTKTSGTLTLMADPVVKGLQTLERDRQLIQQLADLDVRQGPNVTAVAMKIVAATPLVPPAPAPAPAVRTAEAAASAPPPARQPLITAALYAHQQAELGEDEPPEGMAWGEEGRGGDVASPPSATAAVTPYVRAEKKRDDPVLVIIRHGKTGSAPSCPPTRAPRAPLNGAGVVPFIPRLRV